MKKRKFLIDLNFITVFLIIIIIISTAIIAIVGYNLNKTIAVTSSNIASINEIEDKSTGSVEGNIEENTQNTENTFSQSQQINSTNNVNISSQNQQENAGNIPSQNQQENAGNISNQTQQGNIKNENQIEQNTGNTNQTNNNENKQNNANSQNGVIYLTFDDGPSANITPKILDILKENNIKASFFLVNYSDSNEKLVQREVNEGHTVGIHGYSHEYSKIYRSKDSYLKNIYALQEKIKKSTSITTMYTRFPGGSSNTISRRYHKGIMTDLTKELLNRGFKYYDWNICAEDAGSAKNANDVYNYVVKYLSKKHGNMVLMHDFASNKKGLEALPKIIKYAKQNGYTFEAINDDTPMFAQHVNN